jgi:uncharacterized surface anchored protein
MTEAAADLDPACRITGDAIQPALFLDDAGEVEIAAIEAGDLLFEKWTPAIAFA